jgi:hypothetical protein
MLYRYRGIVINVITQDGRTTTAVPVSEEAIRMFTLDEGVIKIPNKLLNIFKHDTREIRRVSM